MDAAAPQSLTVQTPRTGAARFTGGRFTLFAVLLRGFLLYVPTLGIYRFWLVTRKRRFYWSNTEIDGDALEYTGTARQLLAGFMIALLIFVPIYGFFFYLSLQTAEWVVIGYIAAGGLLYFLMGYALFRARRFRLTRTFWRGIRFHQSGSAWSYAWRRLGWSLLMIPTLGLVYPFMSASLWKYRYRHTWFGDRQFTFTGTWKTIAAPFYLAILLSFLFLLAPVIVVGIYPNEFVTGLAGLVSVLFVYFAIVFVQSRILSRFWSSVSVGEARLDMRIRARSLIGMHIWFLLALTGVLIGLSVLAIAAVALVSGTLPATSFETLAQVPQFSLVTVLAVIAGYLSIMAVWSMLNELVLGVGYWKIVTSGAAITNIEDLESVRAHGDESPLAGEGLADALNVGAY